MHEGAHSHQTKAITPCPVFLTCRASVDHWNHPKSAIFCPRLIKSHFSNLGIGEVCLYRNPDTIFRVNSIKPLFHAPYTVGKNQHARTPISPGGAIRKMPIGALIETVLEDAIN